MAEQLAVLFFISGVSILMLVLPFVRRTAARGVGTAAGWSGGLLGRFTVWLLLLPAKSLWQGITLGFAVLSEEVKRWLGLLVGGVLLAGVTWFIVTVTPAWGLIMTMVAIDMLWVWFIVRAAERTYQVRLSGARQRATLLRLNAIADSLPGQVRDAALLARSATGGAIRELRDGPIEEPKVAPETVLTQKEWEAAQDNLDQFGPDAGPRLEPIIPIPHPRWAKDFVRGARRGGRRARRKKS